VDDRLFGDLVQSRPSGPEEPEDSWALYTIRRGWPSSLRLATGAQWLIESQHAVLEQNRGSRTRPSPGVSDDTVTIMYEDRAGRFWVATDNGLNLMDRDHGTLTRFLHNPGNSSSPSGNVINRDAMYEHGSGALSLGMSARHEIDWSRSVGMSGRQDSPRIGGFRMHSGAQVLTARR
jgi:hypothetical protein